MTKIFVDMTPSLDGFVAAPGVSVEHPLGEDGMVLHEWLAGDATDKAVADEFFAGTGAFVIGRRTFDLGEAPWGEDGTFRKPSFVVTHEPRPPLVKGPTTFTFVTEGVEEAVRQAQEAAGGGNVCVMGGASIAQQALAAGLVDELRIHVRPVLLGAGTRLFEHHGDDQVGLQTTRVRSTALATHMIYDVVR
jgi:dihydrofolate reductase